jgi:hypothetical protein
VATSFIDLLRTGAAPFDAPGFAADELTELVHAAMDLLPPSVAADFVAHRPAIDHHEPGSSWADLVAGHDRIPEPLVADDHLAGHPFDHGVDHDPFDFGSGATHRVTTFIEHAEHPPALDAHHGVDAHLHHDDHGWAHDDLTDHGHGLGHDHPLFDDAGHDHVGLHDSVLHDHVHDRGHEAHEVGHHLDHDPAHDAPHHDGGWHHE